MTHHDWFLRGEPSPGGFASLCRQCDNGEFVQGEWLFFVWQGQQWCQERPPRIFLIFQKVAGEASFGSLRRPFPEAEGRLKKVGRGFADRRSTLSASGSRVQRQKDCLPRSHDRTRTAYQ